MSTHNIGFYEDLTKIIFKLSSNTHLISSAGFCPLEVGHLTIFGLYVLIMSLIYLRSCHFEENISLL